MDFPEIALQCGPDISTEYIHRIISVESSFNPFAIGVVGGYLQRQPKTKEEAVVTAKYLAKNGWNFSMGLGQINRYNLLRYGLDYDSVFEPCVNLRAAVSIYQECFTRAMKTSDFSVARLRAFSCYYSGNFSRGFISDGNGKSSYVQRITNVKVEPDDVKGAIPILVVPNKNGKDDPLRARDRGTQKSDYDKRFRRLNGATFGASPRIKELRGK